MTEVDHRTDRKSLLHTLKSGNNPSNGREDVQIFEFFDFQRIIAATDNFSDMKIIGQGQLGPVYKGVLENGEEIAVKRVSRSAHNGNEQLKNELNLLARLKHKNLVKLMGFCIQWEQIILCFEFMPNSSLDQLLYGTRMLEVQLNWEQRFRLIQGISSGLLYLHEDTGDKIIHRDVKPANILLNKNMVPKISDFGISRLFVEDRTFFTTSNIAGTSGYMAPELLQPGMLSTKADVYSFGMVVLEIISGKRNTSCPPGLVSLRYGFVVDPTNKNGRRNDKPTQSLSAFVSKQFKPLEWRHVIRVENTVKVARILVSCALIPPANSIHAQST
ncbi:putative receptor-like protein kinase [Carex littledalei]|uniref:non-specific serine/threonine protein kinase n=1 Tax=Carex littledalei TaxID=544730 RepID=A0A833V2F1_9POAL|nr:putative receptor-like protein kinase [Carex littledalei]